MIVVQILWPRTLALTRTRTRRTCEPQLTALQAAKTIAEKVAGSGWFRLAVPEPEPSTMPADNCRAFAGTA